MTTEISDEEIGRMLATASLGPDKSRHDMERLITAYRSLHSAAILAARSSPEDIVAARSWIYQARRVYFGSAVANIEWKFVEVDMNREFSMIAATDADALDSIRSQLNLSIPGGAT